MATTASQQQLQQQGGAFKQQASVPERGIEHLKAELPEHRIRALLKHKEPLALVRINETVGHALGRMSLGNFSSAVVTDKLNQKIYGFVDTLDFLAFLMKMIGKNIPKTGQPINITKDDLQNISDNYNDFRRLTMDQIVEISGDRGSFVAMKLNEVTYSDILENALKGIQRIVLVNQHGKVESIITSLSMAMYVAREAQNITTEEWLNMRVGDFPYKNERVLVVDKNTRALDAFLQMYLNKLPAVGVLDEDGTMFGNLSDSDLKAWYLTDNETFRKKMLVPVERFLIRTRKLQGRFAIRFVVSVTADNTLRDVLMLIRKHRVHRVYVVDENNRPYAWIGVTDLMKGMAETQQQQAQLPQQQLQQEATERKPALRISPTF